MSIRKTISGLLAICMVLTLNACGKTQSPATDSAAPTGTQTAGAQVTPEQKWAEDNGLNKTETVDELYEAAKKEGKVTIYSISSRIKQVKESFEKQYPGVEVDAFQLSTNELIEKIQREYESGIRNCDVLHVKDLTGAIYNEFIVPGIFHTYNPQDICKTIDPELLKKYTPLYYEIAWWYYNDENYPNGSPITSWWDLTKPEWKGKCIFTEPQTNETYMALLTTMNQNADLLAEDYKKVFGKDLVLSEGCKNAAQEWMKRFVANDPVYESSSGKIAEAVGIRGQKSAPVGFGASVKYRERKDQGWALQAAYKFSPAAGVYGLNTLNIVNEAPHPAAAKLLIRWMMGEADGKGEGFKPFNTIGGWSARSDVPMAEGNIPLSDIPVFKSDLDYVYKNIQDITDFWISIQK